jgi:hypothetical protein
MSNDPNQQKSIGENDRKCGKHIKDEPSKGLSRLYYFLQEFVEIKKYDD